MTRSDLLCPCCGRDLHGPLKAVGARVLGYYKDGFAVQHPVTRSAYLLRSCDDVQALTTELRPEAMT